MEPHHPSVVVVPAADSSSVLLDVPAVPTHGFSGPGPWDRGETIIHPAADPDVDDDDVPVVPTYRFPGPGPWDRIETIIDGNVVVDASQTNLDFLYGVEEIRGYFRYSADTLRRITYGEQFLRGDTLVQTLANLQPFLRGG